MRFLHMPQRPSTSIEVSVILDCAAELKVIATTASSVKMNFFIVIIYVVKIDVWMNQWLTVHNDLLVF